MLFAAYFVAGTDIGKFTMKTVDDNRALNKSVHFRPPCNKYNMNELAALWEMKIGRTLPRSTITEDDLLSAAAGTNLPLVNTAPKRAIRRFQLVKWNVD